MLFADEEKYLSVLLISHFFVLCARFSAVPIARDTRHAIGYPCPSVFTAFKEISQSHPWTGSGTRDENTI